MSNCQRDIIILIVNIAVFLIQRKMLKKLCTVSSLTNLTHKFATHLDVFDYSGQFKKVRLTKDVMKGLGRFIAQNFYVHIDVIQESLSDHMLHLHKRLQRLKL